jgi:hypothetical protein
MKKFKSLKLMLLGVLAMTGMSAFAQEPLTDGTLKFIDNGDGKTATITGFAVGKATADLVIPDQITNLANGQKFTVTAVQDKAFLADKGTVKTIDLKATKVTKITKDMFSNLSNLESITLGAKVDNIADDAFVGTKLKELDLSKTAVTAIGKYFGSSCSHQGTYKQSEANDKNKKTIEKKGGTPVEPGYLKKAASTSEGTKFNSYGEVNEYYKSVYKTATADYPAAVAYQEWLPYTKATANEDNQYTWSECKVKGNNVAWTLTDALAWNVENISGTMYAGYTLDDVTVILFNEKTSGTKVSGNVLTAEDAEYYNEQAFATNPLLAKVGANKFEWNDDKTATVPVLYTDDTAYAYNLTVVAACHKVGEMPDETSTFHKQLTSAQAYFEWNNANVVTPAGGTVKWPGVDINPLTQVTTPAEYYDEAGAYAQNVLLAGSDAVKTGDLITEPTTPVPYASLTSVTLNNVWKTIAPQAFENCSALATVSFGTAAKDETEQPQSIGSQAFLGTAITAFNFVGTNVTTLPRDMFVDYDKSYTKDASKNTSLKSVTFNKIFENVPEESFGNCTGLATVTFEERDILTESAPGTPAVYEVPFGSETGAGSAIGAFAFANTAIESIEIPAALDATETGNISAIDENAFSGCTKLKSFTYMIDNETEVTKIQWVVDELAFAGCTGVLYYTTNANVAAYKAAERKAPKNSSFVATAPDGYVTPFKTVKFKNANKWYIKYKAVTPIKVNKNEAKVYNAYLGGTGEDATLNMSLYKAYNGYYWIGADDVVLIITTNENLEFEAGDTGVGSWSNGSTSMIDPDSYEYGTGDNALNIVTDKDGMTLAEMDAEAGADRVIYGWVNSAAGTGWQHITSGSVFPQNTLYIYAVDEAAGSRLKVNWLDENGNVEETTGIEDVINVNEISNEAIFNLQGVRSNAAQKGVYIKNGKKFVK